MEKVYKIKLTERELEVLSKCLDMVIALLDEIVIELIDTENYNGAEKYLDFESELTKLRDKLFEIKVNQNYG